MPKNLILSTIDPIPRHIAFTNYSRNDEDKIVTPGMEYGEQFEGFIHLYPPPRIFRTIYLGLAPHGTSQVGDNWHLYESYQVLHRCC